MIGIIYALSKEMNIFDSSWFRYLVVIGFLGGYTTFSTFSIESVDLLLSKKFFHAFSYMFLSLSLCLLFTFIGLNFNKIIN